VKFFIPQTKKSEYDKQYQAIIATLKDQLRWPITDRRIYSLEYVHDKKNFKVEVGKLDPYEQRYEVVAILESSTFLVFTRTKDKGVGVTILVNPQEVTGIVNFD
jgi:hypothetical protein